MRAVSQITLEAAASLVKEGDTLVVGGFGMTGNPVHLLHALAEKGTRNLTYVGNNAGEPGLGGGRLLRNHQIRKIVGSFITSNPEAVLAAQAGEIEVELIPQGTFAEALRAGGAGIGGFFTPTSVGTKLAEGKDTRVLSGKKQVFQAAIRGNVAFVRAWKADRAGNLVYRMTEQNFNKAMATAADLVIAEVEEIVSTGEIEPNQVHTPGTFVDYIVQANLSVSDLGSSGSVSTMLDNDHDVKLKIARRAYQEITAGDVVNLGVGIPTLIADLISAEDGIILHTENGMLGMGPTPKQGGALDYPVDAGKRPITALSGSSYFDSADSFAMIRGGHVDIAIMGGLQVDERGNLANWSVPGKPLLGAGGAMDLAVGAKRLIITMTHTDRKDKGKIVRRCTLPLTAPREVDTIITELAVFKFYDGKLILNEIMPGADLDLIKAKTEARFLIP